MFGIAPLTLPAAYLLAAATACAPPPAPIVHMDFVTTPAVQRSDLTSRELGKFSISTTFSHSRNETFTVGGLTVSEFSPVYLIDFDAPADPATGLACLSIKTVQITVHYAPTIYIAKEYAPGTCRFQTTLQHETRHVNTDIITFNELLPALRQAIEDAAVKAGALGPVSLADQDKVIALRDQAVNDLKTALASKTEELEALRLQRQQLIDTRQEYLRISALCAHEPLPRQ